MFPFPLRESNYYDDKETGAFYAMRRDVYDPATGRFDQFDPIGLRGGVNGYLYVRANPLSYIDPLGLADIRIENAMRAAGMPPPLPPSQLRCRVECQVMFYPFCAGAGFGTGLAFSAVATPIVGTGAGLAVSGSCNLFLVAPYCKNKCQLQPSQNSCPLALPSIDPNAKPDDTVMY